MQERSAAVRPWQHRRLFWWGALASALVAFAGFARTYYLKFAFDVPELSGLVHLHGVIMTLWVALLILQSRLISARRVDLHRRLGAAGAALAVLVVVIGVATAISSARQASGSTQPAPEVLAVPLFDMVVFSILSGAALLFRRKADVHGRLMLLATLSLLVAPLARPLILTVPDDLVLPFAFGLMDLLILACIAYDTRLHRRLHPAFGWGAMLSFLSQPLRFLIAGTAAWEGLSRWLTR